MDTYGKQTTIDYIKGLSLPEKAEAFLKVYDSCRIGEPYWFDYPVEDYLFGKIGINLDIDEWRRGLIFTALKWIKDGKDEKDSEDFGLACYMKDPTELYNWAIEDYEVVELAETSLAYKNMSYNEALQEIQKQEAKREYLRIIDLLKNM